LGTSEFRTHGFGKKVRTRRSPFSVPVTVRFDARLRPCARRRTFEKRMESVKGGFALRRQRDAVYAVLFAVTFAMSDRHHVPIGRTTDGRHGNRLVARLTASPSVRDK
jgi:hypothetical protein